MGEILAIMLEPPGALRCGDVLLTKMLSQPFHSFVHSPTSYPQLTTPPLPPKAPLERKTIKLRVHPPQLSFEQIYVCLSESPRTISAWTWKVLEHTFWVREPSAGAHECVLRQI
jgi:hypothetical protein